MPAACSMAVVASIAVIISRSAARWGQSGVAWGAMLCAWAGVLTMSPFASAPTFGAEPPTAFRVYVGTYTGGESRGIYTMRLDLASGQLADVKLAAELSSPSFLAIHPNGRFVYAVSEIGNFQEQPVGGLSALQIQPGGELQLLNQQPSGGSGPCHVSIHPAGKIAFVANYGGGSVASFPIQDDGLLGPAASVINHTGSSINPQRQEAPHAHSIYPDPTAKFAVAADLGTDQVLVYRIDEASSALLPNDPPFVSTPAGGGPRHSAFHPAGQTLYVNDELTSAVSVYAYDGARGALTYLQTLSTLPAGADAAALGNSTAETRVHPNGKFVYVSNRGHNSIAIFRVIDAQGTLEAVGHESTRGKVPRNFGIDPTGQYLLAANQDSGTIAVFRIDGERGTLAPLGEPVAVPMPVCVKFVAE